MRVVVVLSVLQMLSFQHRTVHVFLDRAELSSIVDDHELLITTRNDTQPPQPRSKRSAKRRKNNAACDTVERAPPSHNPPAGPNEDAEEVVTMETEETATPDNRTTLDLSLTDARVDIFKLEPTLKKRCKHSQTTRCGRTCHCHGGRLYCTRQRKSWDALTDEEKDRYINAVHIVHTGEYATGSYRVRSAQRRYLRQVRRMFYRLLRIHVEKFIQIHRDSHVFLPWHRYLLRKYEDLLQRYDCRVTIPYWDWTKRPEDWKNHDIFKAKHFGGTGTRRHGESCVRNGPFSKRRGFVLPDGQCLERAFDPAEQPESYNHIQYILSKPSPMEFSLHLEVAHFAPHTMIGGQMGGAFSPGDPLFFLHHCTVDFQWAQRQIMASKEGAKNKWRELWGRPPVRSHPLPGFPSAQIGSVVNPYLHDGALVEYVPENITQERYDGFMDQQNRTSSGGGTGCQLPQFPVEVFNLVNITAKEKEQFLKERRLMNC